MTTPTNTETLEEIAARIVDERLDEMMSPHQYGSTRGLLIIDFVQALRNERERAAKLLEKRRDQYALVAGVEADVTRIVCTQLAEAIREGR